MIQSIFKFLMIAVVIAIVVGLFGTVAFSWTLDTSPYIATLSSILSLVFYIIPIGKLMPLLIIFISSMVFRIVVSVISTIWHLLPIRT